MTATCSPTALDGSHIVGDGIQVHFGPHQEFVEHGL
jgi:hypothetical protein